MPAPSSRFYPSATCSLASSSRSPPRRRRRSHASLMGQSPSAPPGRSWSRSSLRWPQPGLGLGFVRGFLLGRNKDERMDLANWMRCFLSQRLPAPSAEEEADAEGKAAGRCEGEEVGDQEADHLVVMVNGLYGSSADWKFAAEQFVKRLPGKVFVHRSQSNHSKLTYDGVDLMGERLAEEHKLEEYKMKQISITQVRQVVQKRRNLKKISFVAHSLGGLVTRYAIGKLYEPAMDENSSLDTDNLSDKQDIPGAGKIAGLEPINFITSATPHLGSRWNKQVITKTLTPFDICVFVQLPYLFGIPLLERTAAGTAHFIIGRTGKHLFLTDRDDGKSPLLVRMVEDCDDGKFMSALRSFKRRVAYANLKLTASDEKYPHVINVEKGNSEDHLPEDSEEASPVDNLEERMIRGLTQVSWERVDVCFHKSWLRYNAHNNIQVRFDRYLKTICIFGC
nr:unnamed protein product [Digitaria exilis]